MAGLILNLTIVIVTVVLAFTRPGAGIALALALGRHTFPDRSNPIIPAAPLLLGASILGLYWSGRPVKAERIPIGAAALVAVIALVGSMRPAAGLDPMVDELAIDRAFFLLVVTVPLLLLMPSLRARSVRRDFLLTLVLVPTALVALSIVTGSSDASDTGRSAALGGGPITLATAAGLGILILLFADEDLLPSMWAPFNTPFRIIGSIFLGAGMVLTDSRQPVLSLLIVLGFATFVGAHANLSSLSAAARRRARRVRAASFGLMAVTGLGLFALITADPDSRFALLADPAAELRRSRLDVWTAGWEQSMNSPVLGHGFGSFVRIELVGGALAYPHNLFLELLSEVGPPLGLLASLVLIGGLIAGRHCGRRVIWLLAIYALFGVQFSGDLYNSRYVMAFTVAALTIDTAARAVTPAENNDLMVAATASTERTTPDE